MEESENWIVRKYERIQYMYMRKSMPNYTAGPVALSSSKSDIKSLVQSSILSTFSSVDARTRRLSTPDINCLCEGINTTLFIKLAARDIVL